MTKFKRFIKNFRLKEFVYLALLTVLLVVFSLVMVAIIIIVNVLGFTDTSGRSLWVVAIVFDVILLFVAAVCTSDWLDERNRKKHGLPKPDYTEVKFIGFHRCPPIAYTSSNHTPLS